MLEIVRSEEDVHSSHHRVSRMNFIPGGYAVPAAIREAHAEAESQLIVSAPAETDMQPLSPVPYNDSREDDDDEDEPSTPREDVIPDPPAIPAPQLQIPLALRLANLYRRKSKSRTSKQRISSTRGGGIQHTASILSGTLPTLEEGIPLTERSNSGGPPTRRAHTCQRAENKDKAGQAAQKKSARLVGQIL